MKQRLIDANEAKAQIMEDKIPESYMSIMRATGSGLQAETLNQACDRHIKMLDEQPTVDAVSVVRCKDCKFYEPSPTGEEFGWCNYFDSRVDNNHYCSYGERRENETKIDQFR